MRSFDSTLEFQAASNPGPIWSYGYSEQGGSQYAFVPFDLATPGQETTWTKSNYNHSGTPVAWRNLGPAAKFGVGPGQLSIHPGPRANGDHAILRFTTPKTATYKISGKFFAGDVGRMNARVVLRGAFDHPLQTFAVTEDNSVLNIPAMLLQQGDVVDFVVGNNGDFTSGNTPLSVTVAEVAQSTQSALVLSGGGSRGDFQVGAIHYLYDQQKIPSILCGTSVGAINAIKLAEGENATNPEQGFQGLLKIWQSLQTNEDMYLAETWLSDPDMDPGLAAYLRGETSDLAISGPSAANPALGDIIGFVLNGLSDLSFLATTGIPLLKSLQTIMTKARGVFNLSPIAHRLATQCDPRLIAAWAAQGGRLRLATVSLDSGNLRYVTEHGVLIERDGTPVFDPTGVAPACVGFASDLNAMLSEASAFRVDILDLQQQLQVAAPGAKSALVTQIRSLGAQLAALSTRIDIQRSSLSKCMASHPQDFVLQDIRAGAVASASIPGIFLPIKLGSEYYVDGGIRECAPIQSAVDLGASTVYVVHASSRVLPPFVTPDKGGVIDIVSRAMVGIAIDEVDRSDRLLTRDANAAAATVINIEPMVDLHSITTIDPGLIQISHDYGYMRAADTLESASGRREAVATEIAQLRLSIWTMENAAAGQPDPTHPGPGPRIPDPALGPRIAAAKATLQSLVVERRASGGAVPAGIDVWATQPERHPWLPTVVNDAAFVAQLVPASIPAQGNAAAWIKMRNTGSTTWQSARGYALASQNPQDNGTWGLTRWPLPHDVAPGAEVIFARQTPAPPAQGADFQWRMVQEGVSAFGAASESVHIDVGATAEPAVCVDLRAQIAELKQQIVDLDDLLSGDPRRDAAIRRQIADVERTLATVTQKATDSGCAL